MTSTVTMTFLESIERFFGEKLRILRADGTPTGQCAVDEDEEESEHEKPTRQFAVVTASVVVPVLAGTAIVLCGVVAPVTIAACACVSTAFFAVAICGHPYKIISAWLIFNGWALATFCSPLAILLAFLSLFGAAGLGALDEELCRRNIHH
jgi:hypothetical protein